MFHNLPSTSEKNRSSDRILVLETTTGKNAGIVESNRLHALLDESSLWYLKFEHGSLPGALQQKFTAFSVMLKFVKDYYSKKNMNVKEVLD